jgi:hypothetical protein
VAILGRKNWVVPICLAIFLLLFLIVPDSSPSAAPLDKVERPQSTSSEEERINVDGIKATFQKFAVVMQAIGVDLTVVFLIFGCMIMVLATGLNHPEYMKWGRGTLIISVIMFAVIKIGPIILYSI